MTHVVREKKATVTQFEVFEKTVKTSTIQRTPRTAEILSSFCLLPRIVVVQELIKYLRFLSLFRSIVSSGIYSKVNIDYETIELSSSEF